MSSRFPRLTAAAVATMALTACGGVPATNTSTAPAGTNQGAAAPVTTAASAASSAETPMEGDDATSSETASEGQDAVASFGEAFTWQDGLAVTVSAPKRYSPSEYAAGTDKYKKFISFEIRVVNKTGKAWDPALFYTSVQSDNEEADEAVDSEQLKEAPQTKLLNGREAKFTVAYGVANTQDLVMEVTPDYEHEAVLFQK